MNTRAASTDTRLVRLEEWRTREEPAARRLRSRVRKLELANARLAGAAFAGSILGGALVNLAAAYITRGT